MSNEIVNYIEVNSEPVLKYGYNTPDWEESYYIVISDNVITQLVSLKSEDEKDDDYDITNDECFVFVRSDDPNDEGEPSFEGTYNECQDYVKELYNELMDKYNQQLKTEEAKKAKELEEAKQAFINSWKEDERDFFKSQLRNCDWNDDDDTVDRLRKRIEREYEDWHEHNKWVKTWSDFLDGENVIGYLWGNL